MNCPQCQTPLVMSERQGIEIDFCPQCRGVWLDRGELDKIIARSATVEAGRYRGDHEDDDDDDDDDRRRRMPPPVPGYNQPGYPPPQQPPGGYGQPAGGYPPGQYPPPPYQQGHHDPRYYGHKKKKSFWSELFDD